LHLVCTLGSLCPSPDSNGWSEWGDGELDGTQSTESLAQRRRVSATEIVDAARLLAQNRRLESDLEQLRYSLLSLAIHADLIICRLQLQRECNNKEHVERMLAIAEEDLKKSHRIGEIKEQERVDALAQCKKLLTMVEDRVSSPLSRAIAFQWDI
jgi:hypothetical protein